MGLSYHEFMSLSVREFSLKAQGYWIRHNRYLEGHRMVAHAVISVNMKKGKKAPNPSKIWPLLTDRTRAVKMFVPTPEKLEEVKKRYFK